MVLCKECGQENTEGLEYCDGCGAKLESGPATAEGGGARAESAPAEVTETAAAEQPSVAAEPSEQGQGVAVEAERAAPRAVQATIIRGGTLGKEFTLRAGDNLVGRWDPDSGAFPEVDLEADDPEARISRKHALIRVGEEVTIEDIGSMNGTYVNRGPRLEPGSPVTLKDGDEIIIGKTFLKISIA